MISMENLKRVVTRIAYAQTQDLQNLSHFHRYCLIPSLSLASSLYKLSLLLRQLLYRFGIFQKQRLPVPVISVGNLTWGGNGKTPMVEYIALLLSTAEISPLILTRGYAGGDEAKMLQRHLLRTSAKIGVGANRSTIATQFFKRYGYINQSSRHFERCPPRHKPSGFNAEKIGAVILDDGMQHWSLSRDVEIVMVNGMMPWGNNRLLPLGPLRESLTALRRADVVVIHHADLVSDWQLRNIKATVQEVKETLPVFFSRMSPSHFFEFKNSYSKLPLTAVKNMVVLCVSAIGFADSFVMGIKQISPLHVDRLDFNDHHFFQAKVNVFFCAFVYQYLFALAILMLRFVLGAKIFGAGSSDVKIIKERLTALGDEFQLKPIMVVTEKDYDRDPAILNELEPFKVLVLCSSLQIVPLTGQPAESFKTVLGKLI